LRIRRPFSLRSIFLEHDTVLVVLSLFALCALAWLYLLLLVGQTDAMDGLAGRMMGMPISDGMSALINAVLSPAAATYAEASVNFVLVALMWAVMMVGMMLPSAASTILLFSALERKRSAPVPAGRNACFVGGYLVAWSLFSVAAATDTTRESRPAVDGDDHDRRYAARRDFCRGRRLRADSPQRPLPDPLPEPAHMDPPAYATGPDRRCPHGI
jgi:predicted metal-binding membrane protein